MKHALLAILILGMITPSCKKGEEDPFFSLRTRKNRLSGNWGLEAFTMKSDFGEVAEAEYDPETETVNYRDMDSTEYSRVFSMSLAINREGTYVLERSERFSIDTVDVPFSYTEILVEKGDWEFTGGNGEPTKSQLLMLPTERSSTRSDQGSNINITTIDGPVEGKIYNIDRLSNDELWLSTELIEKMPFSEKRETNTLRFKKQTETEGE